MPHCTVHSHLPVDSACSRCGRPFCGGCLTSIMGKALCEECKQVEVSGVVARRQVHPLAVASLVSAAAGYFTCILVPVACPVAIYLGRRALREMRERRHLGGHTIAHAGILLSVAVLVCAGVSLAASALFLAQTR